MTRRSQLLSSLVEEHPGRGASAAKGLRQGGLGELQSQRGGSGVRGGCEWEWES